VRGQFSVDISKYHLPANENSCRDKEDIPLCRPATGNEPKFGPASTEGSAPSDSGVALPGRESYLGSAPEHVECVVPLSILAGMESEF